MEWLDITESLKKYRHIFCRCNPIFIERTLEDKMPYESLTSGLYVWTCDPTEEHPDCRYYIGKAKCFCRRFTEYVRALEGRITGTPRHIDLSMKKHSWDKFSVQILNVPEHKLDEEESKLIAEYISFFGVDNVFNEESGGTTGKFLLRDRKPRKKSFKDAQREILNLIEENDKNKARYIRISAQKTRNILKEDEIQRNILPDSKLIDKIRDICKNGV